jgi:hypothetical protein
VLAFADAPDEVADAEVGILATGRLPEPEPPQPAASSPHASGPGDQESEWVRYAVVLPRSVTPARDTRTTVRQRSTADAQAAKPRSYRAAGHPGHMRVLVIDDHAEWPRTWLSVCAASG